MRLTILATVMSLIATASVASNHAPIVRTITLDVAGMHCEPCAVSVDAALEALPSVASATVDADSAKAIVTLKDINDEPTDAEFQAAIEAAGYTLTSISR